MCGIFGIISNQALNIKNLVNVSKIIAHRGPDDEGYLLFGKKSSEIQPALGTDSIAGLELPQIEKVRRNYTSVFLHRRLSIIDLSPTGHQPISYDNEGLWITLNGEIYNYIELREELKKRGHIFKSTSDTEVVLAAYKEWGDDCVNRFNGMWAFAIWDRNNNQIFLSRDRVGIKPLYYYHSNEEFIFCSEIKGIRAYLDNNLRLSEKQIFQYIMRGQIFVGESDETIYEEVKQLMPGSNLVLVNGKIKISKYWSLALRKNKLFFVENNERFKKLFFQSLKYRLRSDVEVGSCLSGGLDSSSIVSFASKEFNKRFHTFTVIWPGEKCDEAFFASKVNYKYNCHSNAFLPDLSGLLEVINKVIWHQEIPLSGSSLLAQWFVMEKAKEMGIKVLLDGQGADEILSGYPVYIIPYINEMIFTFKWNELYKHYSSLKGAGYSFKRFLSIQKHKFISKPKPVFPINESLSNKYEFNTKYSIPHKCNYLPEYLKDQIENTNLPSLLHFEDRNSMAHSVESRVPFLDYNMIEFAVNIPTGQKIHGTLTKLNLRESMKSYLPVEIYNRRDKVGFSTPIEQNQFKAGSSLYDISLDYILNSDLRKMDLLNLDLINSGNIFGIYTLAKFIEIWQ